jgi:hypothetical protein
MPQPGRGATIPRFNNCYLHVLFPTPSFSSGFSKI